MVSETLSVRYDYAYYATTTWCLPQLTAVQQPVRRSCCHYRSPPLSAAPSPIPEGQLGVQLFDRVGKRLAVNEHGRLLYPRALALLEQAVEIEQLFVR